MAEISAKLSQVKVNKQQVRDLDFDELRRELSDTEAKFRSLKVADYPLSSTSLYTIVAAYQTVCQRYAYLSTFYPHLPETQTAYELVCIGRRLIYGRRLSRNDLGLVARAQRGFLEVRNYCFLAAVIAVLSGTLTAILVAINPNVRWHFVSEELGAQLQRGRLWTEHIRGMSSLASSQIMTNNITVTFSAFALGVTGGVLTLVIIVVNGAMLGGLFAAVHHYGMAFQLFEFVVAHGFLELSVIMVGAGCGLYLGDALLHPGTLSRSRSLQLRSRPALDVMLFSAAWLIPAGIVEGYVSPYAHVPFSLKLLLGLLLASSYWVLLSRNPGVK